ncbi:MAG TPA: hypothetical protein DCM40_26210, partial [Maribacter sp.]|nr:hypothetical protein [Maribacter sp.]
MATKFNSNELSAGPVSRNVDESLIVEINTGAAQNLNVSLENLEPNESYIENNLSPDLEYFLKPSILIEEEAINDTKIAFVTIKNYAGEDTYDLSKDMHDLYLRNGITYYTRQINQTADPIENAFAVYFIKNGKAQVIPDYKTLEVLLVKEGLNYRDIRPASPDEILSYDLNFDGRILDPTNAESGQEVGDTLAEYRARLISTRSDEWNYRIRKESGYRVGGDFKRDPGDYVRYNNDLFFVGYSETVFLDQTATEKLRAK